MAAGRVWWIVLFGVITLALVGGASGGQIRSFLHITDIHWGIPFILIKKIELNQCFSN